MGLRTLAFIETGGDAAADTEEVAAAWRESPWSRVPWRHEVALAYSPERDTGRELSLRERRGYDGIAAPDEIPGTADLLLDDPGRGLVTVADIKTGRQEHTEAAGENAQLRFLALAATRASGVSRARVVLLFVSASGVDAEDAELGPEDFAVDRETLRSMLAGERIARASPQPGPHCHDHWCPARSSCPATLAAAEALVQLMPEPRQPVRFDLNLSDASDVAITATRDRLAVIRDLCDRVEVECRRQADLRDGIRLPGGHVWRRVLIARESIGLDGPVGAEAQDLLRELLLGDAAYRQAVEIRTSKAGIERALRWSGLAPSAAKKRLEDVLDALRGIGAVRSRETPSYQERAR